MRTKFKAWTVPYLEEHQEYSLTDEEISSLDDFYLEIGSGKGDFIIQMAEKYPHRLYLGVEKNVTCAGITLKKIVEKELNNVKFLFRDGAEVIRLLKDHSVNKIYLNFSDPWPKKRHSKRRLTSISFLGEYKRILKKDGQLIFKTDDLDLFNFSLEMFSEAGFKKINVTYDYDALDNEDAVSEYQTKATLKGISIKRAVLGL